jgi:S-adenosylmethionine decarboxylase proenzyme
MPIGYHTLIDLSGCNAQILNDAPALEAMLYELAARIGATPVKSVFHPFAPIGVSGVLVIAESHITIHTWPEHGFAALDFFTCGAQMQVEAGIAYLKEVLGAAQCTVRDFERGNLSNFDSI